MPGTFSGNEEMLALGLGMKGLPNSVFELLSDHLGEDEEWAWVTEFQKQTGLTATLIATTAPAYENGKMYKLAGQARERGHEIEPQAAGRPTGVLHGLQSSFHAFVGHPTWRAELAALDHDALVTRLKDPDIKARILAEESVITSGPMQDLPTLMSKVFPLGEDPDYDPDYEGSVAGIDQAQGKDPMEVMYDLLVGNDGKELFYQPLGGYQSYTLHWQKMLLEHPNVLFRPEAIFDLPAGGRRLVQKAEGYDMTIKSGEVIFQQGEHTGALPGKLVRRSDSAGQAA